MIFLDHNNQEHSLPSDRNVEWRIGGYALIQNEKGELLMVTPTWRNTYDLPGGGIEPSETLVEGTIRECYEETGYKIKIISDTPFYISESNFYWERKDRYCHSVNFMYRGSLISSDQDKGVINTVELNEIAEVKWVHSNEITEQNCHGMYLPAIDLFKVS